MAPRTLLSAASLVVLLWGLSQSGAFLIPVCIAALLAFLLAPLVKLMRRNGVPEIVAVIGGAIVLVLPFSAIGYLLFLQSQRFIVDFPHLLRSLETTLHHFAESSVGQKLHLDGYLDPEILGRRIAAEARQGVSLVISGLGAVLGATSQLALVLLFTVLMVASRHSLRRSGDKIFEALGPALLNEVTALIERFLVARLVIVLIVAAVDSLILVGFGLEYALLMGALLGVLTLVPAIGFILGLLPPVVVAVASGNTALTTAMMALALFVISIIEGNVLTPKLVGHSLNINALATFVGLFAGGLVWGVWGMVLAIPVLGVLRIVFAAIPRLQPWAELLAAESITPARRNTPASRLRGRRPDEHVL